MIPIKQNLQNKKKIKTSLLMPVLKKEEYKLQRGVDSVSKDKIIKINSTNLHEKKVIVTQKKLKILFHILLAARLVKTRAHLGHKPLNAYKIPESDGWNLKLTGCFLGTRNKISILHSKYTLKTMMKAFLLIKHILKFGGHILIINTNTQFIDFLEKTNKKIEVGPLRRRPQKFKKKNLSTFSRLIRLNQKGTLNNLKLKKLRFTKRKIKTGCSNKTTPSKKREPFLLPQLVLDSLSLGGVKTKTKYSSPDFCFENPSTKTEFFGTIGNEKNFHKKKIKKKENILKKKTVVSLKKLKNKTPSPFRLSTSTHRWVEGMLTNWRQLSHSVQRYSKFSKQFERIILTKNLVFPPYNKATLWFQGFVRTEGNQLPFTTKPDLIFIVNPGGDSKGNQNILQEGFQSEIPIVGIIDSNTDYSKVGYPILASGCSKDFTLFCLKKIIQLALFFGKKKEKGVLKKNQNQNKGRGFMKIEPKKVRSFTKVFTK